MLQSMGSQKRWGHDLATKQLWGFSGCSVVKNLPANPEDPGSIPESRGPPGGGNGNPLQCSCLESPMDRRAWWDTVHGVTKSQTGLK